MLLLNAGLMAVHHDLTEDGHDVQLQVNHLGHFLLAHELLPLLVAAGATGAPARVVSHASHAHHLGWPSFSAATADGPVGGGFRALPLGLAAWVPGASCWARYGQSKLCNVLFTAELQRRLAANGAGVIATAAHPGVAFTQLVQVAAGANPLWDYLPSWHRYVPAAEAVGVAQSCADGSTPLLLAATDADAVGGEYHRAREARRRRAGARRRPRLRQRRGDGARAVDVVGGGVRPHVRGRVREAAEIELD